MKCKNIQCRILIDDTPLDEFQEKLEGNDMSCYIASEAGKRFMLETSHDIHEFDFSCHYWIDGQRIECLCFQKADSHIVRGARVDENRLRTFIFSPIQLTDDDDALQANIKTIRDLGTITFKLFRITVLGRSDEWYRGSSHFLEEAPKAIHERAKKAGGHRITLGNHEDLAPSRMLNTKYVDSLDEPYLTFTFRYRPKDILQAQGIIPLPKRPASPTHSAGPSKRPRQDKPASSGAGNQPQASGSNAKLEDSINIDDLRAQRDALDEQIRRAEAAECVKREVSPIILEAGHASGDVIDLTDD